MTKARPISFLPDYIAAAVMTWTGLQAFANSLELRGATVAFMMIVVVAMLLSYATRYFGQNNTWLAVGPWLGALLGFIGWMLPLNLAGVMPTENTGQLMVGGRVIWLLVLRCFALWTDGDLVFQAVPTMALFGLAATYTPEPSLVGLFIIFVLCVIFLLARQHVRLMLTVGVLGRASAQSLTNSGTLYAVLTTVAVILGSFLVTPVMQSTMQVLVSQILHANIGRGPNNLPTTNPNTDTILEIGVGGHSSTNVKVMSVKADRPLYLRERAFGAFNGVGWTGTRTRGYQIAPTTAPGGPVFDLGDLLSAENRSRTESVEYEVTILSGLHESIYVVGEPTVIRFDAQELMAAPEVKLWARNSLRPGNTYSGMSVTPPRALSVLRRTEAPAFGSGQLRDIYYQLPPGRSPQLMQLAQTIVRGRNTDLDRVEALRQYIANNCKYSLTEPPYEQDQDRISEFLFVRKKGYCDSFASALAILCREMRIPARVVRGYAPGDYDSKADRWIVREKHYHLWTEVFFNGIGWVIFDAVEGAQVVEETQGAAVAAEETQSFWRSPWPPVIIDSLVALVVLYLVYTWWRGRTVMDNTLSERREVGVLYSKFLKSLKNAGIPTRRPDQTPSEFLGEIQSALPPPLASQAQAITEEVDRALFQRSLSEDTLNRLRGQVAQWQLSAKGLKV